MISIPDNTVLDTEMYSHLTPEAIHFLKLKILNYCRKCGINVLTPTQTIDTILDLQARGCVKILFFEDGDMRIQVTPIGAVDTWLARHTG